MARARSTTNSRYRTAFERAPVGMVLSEQRTIVDCNAALADIFATTRAALIGRSLAVLYPTSAEFDRIGTRIIAELTRDGRYADNRIMKREPDNPRGELFWCHVIGRALDLSEPHRSGVWVFEDVSSERVVERHPTPALTPRERQVAPLLIDGKTSKEIGVELGLSPRTIEIYRATLLRKYGATDTDELVRRLVADSAAGDDRRTV